MTLDAPILWKGTNESRGDPEIITSKADKGGVVVGYQGLKKKKFKFFSFKFIYYIWPNIYNQSDWPVGS